MAANPAQLVPPVAQQPQPPVAQQPQPQPPVAQQPYPQQRRRTAQPPTVQYSSAEVFGLLHIIEQILPVDGEDWNEVSRLHVVNFPNNGRDGPKLKRKFQQLHRSCVPTGDPMCPPDVRRAKRLKELIRGRGFGWH